MFMDITEGMLYWVDSGEKSYAKCEQSHPMAGVLVSINRSELNTSIHLPDGCCSVTRYLTDSVTMPSCHGGL